MKLLLIICLSLCLIHCANKSVEKIELDATSKKLGRAKLPQDPGFLKYGKAVRKKLSIVPNKTERSFAQNYVDYMLSGDPKQGQKLIKILKEGTTKNRKSFSSDWISIFGGGEKLLEKKINLGVMTSTRLMKLISFGDPTSIEFLLVYSAAVELNEMDAMRIRNYEGVIKTSYKEIRKASILKNEAFFLDYPPAI